MRAIASDPHPFCFSFHCPCLRHCRRLELYCHPGPELLPCPGPLPASPGSSVSYCSVTQSSAVSSRSVLQCPGFIFFSGATLVSFQSIAMVHTRGGSRLRPRVRFSTLELEEQTLVPAPVPAPVPAQVPEAVPEEPQGFRRYQTRMGPRAPSPVPQLKSRRARPSKRARTSGLGESSSSRPQPSPATSAAEATSSP